MTLEEMAPFEATLRKRMETVGLKMPKLSMDLDRRSDQIIELQKQVIAAQTTMMANLQARLASLNPNSN
jgi:hypothetical protein